MDVLVSLAHRTRQNGVRTASTTVPAVRVEVRRVVEAAGKGGGAIRAPRALPALLSLVAQPALALLSLLLSAYVDPQPLDLTGALTMSSCVRQTPIDLALKVGRQRRRCRGFAELFRDRAVQDRISAIIQAAADVRVESEDVQFAPRKGLMLVLVP